MTAVQPSIEAALLVRPDAWGMLRSILDASPLLVVSDRLGENDVPRYMVSAADPTEAAEDLTPRELQVLQLAAQGHETADIAELLFLSGNTVKTHLTRLMRKLGARNRTQAVAIGYQRGLFEAVSAE